MNNLIEYLPEISLKILRLIRYKYPWKTLRLIFLDLKLVSQSFYVLISGNEDHICKLLEIPRFHFLAGTNQSHEIIKFFNTDNTNQGLRAPDKWGYSPSCYACGNHAYRAMQILKIGYALDTDEMPNEKLHRFMKIDQMHFLLENPQHKNNQYPSEKLEYFYDSDKIEIIEQLLTWNTIEKELFLEADEVVHHVKLNKYQLLNDSYINQLIVFAYKNKLIKDFWNIVNDNDIPIDAHSEEIMQLCVYNNINFNTCDEKGNVFLHKSIFVSLYIIKFLVEQKNIAINICTLESNSSFLYAQCTKYSNDITKLLIESGKLIYDDKSIYFILQKDKHESLQLILDNGFEPTIKHLIVALCVSIRSVFPTKCIEILLDRLQKINILRIHDKIDILKLFKNDYTRKLLFEHGILLMEICINKHLPECLEILLNYRQELLNKNVEFRKYTPLYLASLNGDIDSMKILIKYGAEIDIRCEEEYGFTPLQIAIYQNNDINCAIMLLDSGANVNLQIDNINSEYDGYTALHLAVEFSDINMVQLLLDYGADKNLRMKYGLTAKEFALTLNRNDIAEIL